MDGLIDSISRLVGELQPDRLEQVASRIAASSGSDDAGKLRDLSVGGIAGVILEDLGRFWKATPRVSPGELAMAIRAAGATASSFRSRQGVELVWTGPDTGLVPVRRTEQVLLDLIGAATDRLFIVTFVAFVLPAVVEALKKAADRGVKIRMLLESSSRHGGTLTVDSVRMMKESVPKAQIYVWPSDKRPGGGVVGASGSVHAKCAVADSMRAFVTSANLTDAAMERNMELGVVLFGGGIPRQLNDHLDALVVTGILEEVP